MAETVDSVLAEIADGLRTPEKDSFTYELIEDMLQEIVELRQDTLLPAYKRQYAICELEASVHDTIARSLFESRVASNQRKWYSGGSSVQGFLGWGESLETVLATDATTLVSLGVSAKDLGLKLKQILDASNEAEGFTVESQAWRGFQDCPFDDCSSNGGMIPHAHIDFTIVNTRTGEGIMGPGMMWHLAAKHAFFEGKRSPYRVEPAQLAKVLFG